MALVALTSRSAVIEALAAGRFDDLLGTRESSWLDFKGSPYALDAPKGKFELCKDVAAFANAHGGLVICGVAEQKLSHEPLAVAGQLKPFPRTRADLDRNVDVLNEYLRPRVAVRHLWYPDPQSGRSSDATAGYLVIEVEPVPEPSRYVVVRRVLNDSEQFVEGLSVPIRHGDRTIYLPSEDVYQLINEGLRTRESPGRIPVVAQADLQAQADNCLGTLEQLQDWEDTPLVFWQSIPPGLAGILPGFYREDGIRGRLRNQDVLRSQGFNFRDDYGRLVTHEGSLFLGRGRCALLVRSDGLMTAGAVATPDMLCWAMESRGRPERINVYVLTEMTLEYFRLADKLLIPLAPGRWRHRIVARRFHGEQPRTLGPGGVRPDMFLTDAMPASADTWDASWQAVGDPERDAFEALAQVYALFGLDVATNPDVEGDRVAEMQIRTN